MKKKRYDLLGRALLIAAAFLTLSGCGPMLKEQRPRYFWPPPPAEPKIEYINFYFSDKDLQRGVDHRVEHAILGQTPPVRLINQPYSVASDGKGRIAITDFFDHKVIIFDLRNHASRQLTTTAGAPQKVTFDSSGGIWILDSETHIIQHFSADEQPLGAIELKETGRPASLAVDMFRQRIYVSDAQQHHIHIYGLDGSHLGFLGSRGNAPGEFNYPTDLDLDGAGNLHILDTMNARIQVLSPDGLFLRAFGERGTAPGSFAVAKGIAVSPSGLVYVTDASQHKIVIFNAAGEYLLTIGGRYVFAGREISPGGFYFPAGIDADLNESFFVADLLNGMIHEFQYLTPAALKARPLDQGEAYQPRPSDLLPKNDAAPALPAVPEAPVLP